MEATNFLWTRSINCNSKNVTLKTNECCLDIVSHLTSVSHFYIRSLKCYECDFSLRKSSLQPHHTTSLILDTDYGWEFYVEQNKRKLCNTTFHFGNLGRYTWNISENFCEIHNEDAPEPFWLDIAVLSTIFIVLLFAYGLYTCFLSTRFFSSVQNHVSFHELEADLGNPNAQDRNKSYIQGRTRRQSRIASIDTFRGLSITLMIFVNYGGSGHSLFKHSPWNGLTIADLVFPWFIWIMGVSIVLSLRSKLRTSASRKKIFAHILKRTVLLLTLGLMLNSGKIKHESSSNNFSSFSLLRIPGVLQRIGLTYFIVASTELLFIKPQRNEQFGPWYFCPEIVDSSIQWIVSILFVVVHELITFKLPVPGCPEGYLGPGGWHEHSNFSNCTGGAAGYIDRLLFLDNHLYQHPTFEKIYHTYLPYDPEGLLGTLTTIFCAFLGVHTGRVILCYENTFSRFRRWQIMAILLGLIAGQLCSFSENGGLIPVNKNLWSLSYVLATSSMAFFMFSFLYYCIDYRGFISGLPFSYAGMNAIVLYIGHEVFKNYLPWHWKSYSQTHGELLAMNLIATIFWLVVAYFLYKRNIFITL